MKDSDSKKVSVIIPFYSTETGFLLRSVQSVLEQTYKNIEILIVDDCSPITAISELQAILPHQNIKIIRNSTNRHGAYSRNRGIGEAVGEYIALLDADDYWDNEHIEICVDNINNNDFIYSNINRVIDGVITKRESSDINDFSKDLMADILLSSPPQTNSFFFKRSCFLTIQFDEDLKRHQDYQFFIDFCLSAYKVQKVDKYTAYYVDTNYIGKVIDYHSINEFWRKYKCLASPDRLQKFLIEMIVYNLRGSKPNILAVRNTILLLPQESLYKKISISLTNEWGLKVLTYIYYYLYIDLRNFPKKIIRKLMEKK